MATITVRGHQFELLSDEELRIGRDPALEIPIDNPQVSRLHASIRATSTGEVHLIDLGSTNGIFKDNTRVVNTLVTAETTFFIGGSDGEPVKVTPLPSASPLPEPSVSPAAIQDITNVGSPLLDRSNQTILMERQNLATAGEITIGRAGDNTIVLHDPLVSRHHARLRPVGGGFQITDLSSLNGLQLNGIPAVSGTVFRPGDRLSLGRTTLEIVGGQIVTRAADRAAALVASGITYTLKRGHITLLRDISFTVPTSGLVAVVGPSGAGKSTLLRAITGSQPATSGQVLYQGEDLYQNFAQLRQLIGVVPQDDVVHRQLTVRRALTYAAELRLPGDYDREARTREVDRVINDLGLSEHQGTLISRLSGGQRKRTSVAMELLTQPELLLLDEPTSGLDPGLDLDVMRLLRSQADGGRTVLVVTHSTDNLDLCDRVLILAPGGMVAYYGEPSGVLPYFGYSRYAEVFKALSAEPQKYATNWVNSPQGMQVTGEARGVWLNATRTTPHQTAIASGSQKAPGQRASRQWSTLIRRQLRIITADKSYALSTFIMPLVIAAMALVIQGKYGFTQPPKITSVTDPEEAKKFTEASQLLVIITVGSAFMGMSASIRELIGERAIFLRERTVGLSPIIYLFSKAFVLFGMTLIQSGLLIWAVLLRKDEPEYVLWAPNGAIELWLAAFATAFASATLGLLLSALVTTGEQTMPALVVTVMGMLVFCGGLVEITGQKPLEIIAAFFPSRWGYAMAASAINLRQLNERAAEDPLWEHTLNTWGISVAAIAIISVLCLIVAGIRLVRQRSST